MILETILNAIYFLIDSLLGWINLPSYPHELVLNATLYIDYIITFGSELIGFFIPWNIVTLGLPIALVVSNAKYFYQLVMWILRKIPMLNIS